MGTLAFIRYIMNTRNMYQYSLLVHTTDGITPFYARVFGESIHFHTPRYFGARMMTSFDNPCPPGYQSPARVHLELGNLAAERASALGIQDCSGATHQAQSINQLHQDERKK